MKNQSEIFDLTSLKVRRQLNKKVKVESENVHIIGWY